MKRKDFLKGLGLTALASTLNATPGTAEIKKMAIKAMAPPSCTLIPTETAGPFPLDLTENAFYFRQDVRESKTGALHNLKIRIIGASNCQPMPNVRVNIWHCDKDGNYSGYGTQTGLTYLRGYQMTDVNGEVDFTTIFPGWYPGRICHIHFQVYVSSMYQAISQLTYPLAEKNAVYAAYPSLYTKGADPLSFNQDGIFADGYAFQLTTLTTNPDTGAYDSFLEVAIQGNGTSGYAQVEPETGGQFKLLQNFPNPYSGQTTIPFELSNRSQVQIDFFDLAGQKVSTLDLGERMPGSHQVPVNLHTLGIPTANYVYQLEVRNENGTFRQCKVMSAAK
ncbi:MAG: hypothetical protein IPL65_13670 [Lewinellaceae bacterium]|nr:hypothetical protein [Lewinellaceae bacterium]